MISGGAMPGKKYNPWRRAYKEFRNLAEFRALLAGKRLCNTEVATLSRALGGTYLVSTNSGLYRIAGDRVRRVLGGHFYGIAVSPEYFYVATYFGTASAVLRGRLSDLASGQAGRAMELIYLIDVASTHSRIHQIYFANGILYIANTGKNAILEYDEAQGRLCRESYPFVDHFDAPVKYDNNHINGVARYHDYTVFSAYRAGPGSLIGVIDRDGLVTGYRYRNIGVHEIFVDHDDIYFCDTFGDKSEPDKGGCLIHSRGRYSGIFDQSPGWIIRGLSGNARDELLVGHSHKGERSKRYKGNASLLLFRDGQLVTEFAGMPWAQTYQITMADGRAVIPDDSREPIDVETLKQTLQSLLGDPVYSRPVYTDIL